MKRFFKALLSLPLLGGLAYLLYLNLALFHQPATLVVQGRRLDADVLAQLRHLRGELHAGAGADMQELYPEGFVFLNALYALTWSEVAAAAPAPSALHVEALTEARWANEQIAAEPARSIFDRDLPLPYGAFYNGWLSYALAKQLAAEAPSRRQAADVTRFRRHCARLAAVLDSSASPYPESYFGAAWPADAAVGVAALAVHDRLFAPRHQGTIHNWLRKAAVRTDTLGMLPHEADSRTGQPRQGARGASLSLMLVLLADIEPAYGRQQFRLYQRYFVDQRLGLPGIREYPRGTIGSGDIDSGPVIWGIGGAASVVGRRAAQLYGDTALAAGLRNSLAAFGLARTAAGQRSYLLGQLPIADAFLAWSNAVAVSHPLAGGGNWRWRFQLYSAGAGVLLGLLLWRLQRLS